MSTNIQDFAGDIQIRGTTFIKANSNTNNLAIGTDAGLTVQGEQAIGIGLSAGKVTQGQAAVAVGRQSGVNNQGNYATAVGYLAGQTEQGDNAVAMGRSAGNTSQGVLAVAVGSSAGQTSQGDDAVAVGYQAGLTGQGARSVAIGKLAGSTGQSADAVAIGRDAATTDQAYGSVAVGFDAARTSQGNSAVAVGRQAGQTDQGSFGVALGYLAGQTSQGDNAIAIGERAGLTNQGNNSIILNATGVALDSTTASSFHVKPVRGGDFAASALAYTSTGEIVEETGTHFDGSGNVGIGTNAPVSGLTVFKDIESSNSFITERVLFKETWPNGHNSLVGDLGTWVVTNLNQQSNPDVETTPDGYTLVAFNGATAANGEFVSPAFDLSNYAIVDGTLQADDIRKTTTRVFLKCWFGARQLDAADEVAQVQFSPDNGSTWYTVATLQDRLNDERFTMVSADLSPYILETSTTAKIRFYWPWISGSGDYMRIGRIWIHESDVPTNLGGMWLGAGGNIGIGTTNPVGVNGGRRLEGSSSTGFEYIATRDDTSVALDDFVGAYLFKSSDTNGTAPHYAGMSSKMTDTFGRMDLRFHTNRDQYEADTPQMIIDEDGQVGIGKDAPGVALDVVGDILASGNITAYSDRRLKSDIERIEGALDKVCALGGYTFTMNDKRSTGLIAQEVKEVLPEAVHGSEETHYSLAYGNVIGLIVEAIKELKEKVG